MRYASSTNSDISLSNCKHYSNSYAVFPVLFLACSYIKVVALKPSKCGMQMLVIGHRLCVKLTMQALGLAWIYFGLPGVLLLFVLFYEELSNSFGNYLVLGNR